MHRHDLNFDGPVTSPSSIWSPFVKKTTIWVILNNTILRVVVKTSTCDRSGGLWRFVLPKKWLLKFEMRDFGLNLHVLIENAQK